jgi:hypothetical protein
MSTRFEATVEMLCQTCTILTAKLQIALVLRFRISPNYISREFKGRCRYSTTSKAISDQRSVIQYGQTNSAASSEMLFGYATMTDIPRSSTQ